MSVVATMSAPVPASAAGSFPRLGWIGLTVVTQLHSGAWWAAVLGAAAGLWWPGVLGVLAWTLPVLLWFRASRHAALCLVAAGIGFALDTILAASGLVTYHGGFGALAPAWMVALWFQSGVTLPWALPWLLRTGWIAVVSGALLGPAAYAGGAGVGALAWPAGAPAGLIVTGLLWAIALPIFAWCARHLGCVTTAVVERSASHV